MKLRNPALVVGIALMSAVSSAADLRLSRYVIDNTTNNSFYSQNMEQREDLSRCFESITNHNTYAGQCEKAEAANEWAYAQQSHKLGGAYDIDNDSNFCFEASYNVTKSSSNDSFVMRIP